MFVSAGLQLSLVSTKQLTTLQRRLSWSPSMSQPPAQAAARLADLQKLVRSPSTGSFSSDSTGLVEAGKLKSQ